MSIIRPQEASRFILKFHSSGQAEGGTYLLEVGNLAVLWVGRAVEETSCIFSGLFSTHPLVSVLMAGGGGLTAGTDRLASRYCSSYYTNS